ncbi:MAG: sensor histidine kinase [Oscillospiraceae bacterium]|nr:sensor histidine kinase [Oscillospiraceae bacterium]
MKSFVKEHIKALALLVICTLFFLIAFMLYGLPLGACLYPALLSLALILIFALSEYIKKKRKHMALMRLLALPPGVVNAFEEYKKTEDEDYRRLISLILQRENDLRLKSEASLSDALDYFTTWVHQIKTPIASMRLTLANEDSALGRKLSGDLFAIEQYVEMVLGYLRLGAGTSDYVIKEYELDPIIRGILRKFASLFIGKGIKIAFTPTEKTIVTDEKWLSMAIEQLISNAVKYTPAGGSVDVYMQGDCLCIKDSGIGIDASDLPRIFERGYTGLTGRNDRTSSGIGLFLCKSICDSLGAEVSVSSVPGRGSCFRLRLPDDRRSFE